MPRAVPFNYNAIKRPTHPPPLDEAGHEPSSDDEFLDKPIALHKSYKKSDISRRQRLEGLDANGNPPRKKYDVERAKRHKNPLLRPVLFVRATHVIKKDDTEVQVRVDELQVVQEADSQSDAQSKEQPKQQQAVDPDVQRYALSTTFVEQPDTSELDEPQAVEQPDEPSFVVDLTGDWDAATEAQTEKPGRARKSRKPRAVGREDSDIDWGSDGAPNRETDDFMPLKTLPKAVSAQADIIADWMENAEIGDIIDPEREHVTLEDLAIQEAHEIQDAWMSGEENDNSGDEFDGNDEFDDEFDDDQEIDDDDDSDGLGYVEDSDGLGDEDVDLGAAFDEDDDDDQDEDLVIPDSDDDDDVIDPDSDDDIYTIFGIDRSNPIVIDDDSDEDEDDDGVRNKQYKLDDSSDDTLGLEPWSGPAKKRSQMPDFRDTFWEKQLAEQWEKDRASKAKKKAARQAARHAQTHDLFPNTHGKLTKAKLKKKLRSEKLAQRSDLRAFAADSARERPDAALTVDTLADVNNVIVRFLAMPSHTTLALPPMHKGGRALVHDLANAYSIKSKSRGGGKNRFTVLYKTQNSGKFVDVNRVRGIVRIPVGLRGESDERAAHEYRAVRTPSLTKNRNGSVVGGGARTIGSDNIGHRLLASMGWSEGQGLGADGLAEPILATVKVTRGGLGY
ncbi:squalene synthetase-like protein [Malassezia cuniculi]|uniref:Squalene synthetase-like protein n=1 Tax=Malassezia cuniculi TaxID=948313 RepID=A0AAF0ER80_9BASI|nr:squalene synthetase-like protein [Malassezia cuniculi]